MSSKEQIRTLAGNQDILGLRKLGKVLGKGPDGNSVRIALAGAFYQCGVAEDARRCLMPIERDSLPNGEKIAIAKMRIMDRGLNLLEADLLIETAYLIESDRLDRHTARALLARYSTPKERWAA